MLWHENDRFCPKIFLAWDELEKQTPLNEARFEPTPAAKRFPLLSPIQAFAKLNDPYLKLSNGNLRVQHGSNAEGP